MSKRFIYHVVLLKLIEGVVVRGCCLFAGDGEGGRAEEAAAHEAGAGGGGGRDAEDRVDLTDHHVPDEVDEEVLYQAALPHLPLLLGGGGAGQSRGGKKTEAQENGLDHLETG